MIRSNPRLLAGGVRAALLLALGVFGCSKETESLVVVTAVPADSNTTGLDTLIVSVGKTSQTFALPSPLTIAGVKVGVYVPESQTGSQNVTATATHATGACGPGYQTSQPVTIAKAGDTVSVSITMAAETTCPPTTGSTGTGGHGTGGTGTGGTGTGGTGGTGTGGTGGSSGGTTGGPNFSRCTEIDHGDPGTCASCTLGGTTDVSVYGVAISPNSTIVVTGATDGRIKRWTNTNGTLTAGAQAVLTGTGLGAVAFSPDGSNLAVGRTGTVDIVNVSTWTVTRSLSMTAGQEAYGVAFSPDGTTVFTVALDGSGTATTGTLYAHAVGTVQPLKTVSVTSPFALAVSPITVSGALPVSVTDQNGTVSIYSWSATTNTFTGPVALTVTSDGSIAEAAAFSPHGAVFAAGGDDGILNLWNFPTTASAPPDGQINIGSLTQSGDVGAVAFSPDGSYVGVGGEVFGSLTAYSLADGSQVGVEYDSSYDIISMAFSPSSNVVVAGEYDCGCIVVCPQ